MIDITTLKQIPITASLNDAERNALRPNLGVRELRKNSVVVLREGTPGEEMYLVASSGR